MTPEYGEDIPYEIIPESEQTADNSQTRAGYWTLASELQSADGLETSAYAHQAASKYIVGEISANDLAEDLHDKYQRTSDTHGQTPAREHAEADIVAGRIVSLLDGGLAFICRLSMLPTIHKALFDGINTPDNRAFYPGQFRTVNLSKPEPVLGGRSVEYADYSLIATNLDYDFDVERRQPYPDQLDDASIRRFSKFISNIWQTHPFREGNTRTTAVFSELYLRSLGVDADNEPSRRNGKLFRDALVRANYANYQLGVDEDRRFLQAFFTSIVRGERYPYTTGDLNLHGIREKADIDYRGSYSITLPEPLEDES